MNMPLEEFLILESIHENQKLSGRNLQTKNEYIKREMTTTWTFKEYSPDRLIRRIIHA